jgi:hypothetical protein
VCEIGHDDTPAGANKAGCSSSAVTPYGSNKRPWKANVVGAQSRQRASQTVFDKVCPILPVTVLKIIGKQFYILIIRNFHFFKLEELQSQQSPLDEKAAFGKWFCVRLTKVPDERLDDLQDTAQNLLKNFTQ